MGMESGSGLSVADALALQNRNNDGMFGGANGTWIWVFFLFFLLAWGGGGFGFGNNAAAQGALTRAELYDGLNYNQLENAVRGIQSGLCDGFYAQNTTMLQGMNGIQNQLCQGFNGVNSNIAESRFAAQQCCWATSLRRRPSSMRCVPSPFPVISLAVPILQRMAMGFVVAATAAAANI